MKYHIYLPDSTQFGITHETQGGYVKYVGEHELDFYSLYSAEFLWSAYGMTHWSIQCDPATLTFLTLKLGIVLGKEDSTLF